MGKVGSSIMFRNIPKFDWSRDNNNMLISSHHANVEIM